PFMAQGVAFVRVAVPLDQVQQQLAEIKRIVWSAAVISGLAGMLLAFWLSRRLTKPLRELTRGAERIAAAEFGGKVYLESRDEVGVLARTFNNMSQRLAEQFSQLEEDRQQLRTILSGMEEGVIALD